MEERTFSGTVIRATGSWYEVRTEAGERLACRIRGRLRLGVAVLFDEEVVLRYAKPATPPNPES